MGEKSEAAAATVVGAKPLRMNGYKVEFGKSIDAKCIAWVISLQRI